MRKVLITGITGFAGSHLAEHCLDKGDEVYGTFRWRSPLDNLRPDTLSRVKLEFCELTDGKSIYDIINKVRPDFIFHLAGQSYVPQSWVDPRHTLETNIFAELNIFEAIRKIQERHPEYSPVIQIAGSSEEYGLVKPEEAPIKETNDLRPLSPYGVSKVAQDLLGYQYFQSHGLKVIRTRAFNHEGPRRGEVFVISNWCKQIAMAEAGLSDGIIKHGNLEAQRDFTHVKDTVSAYYLLCEKGEPGEVYNICSGVAYTMEYILAELLNKSKTKVSAQADPTRMRPSDVQLLLGDNEKLSQLGWGPTKTIDDILNETLEYWRSHYDQK